MLNRKFTFRENLLLVILSTLLVGVFYYLFFLEPVYAKIRDNQKEQSRIQEEIVLQTERLGNKQQMLEQLEKQTEALSGAICPYDNMKSEMREIGRILSETEFYNISARQPVEADSIVRRDVFISFQTKTYEDAYEIVEGIENGAYRCLVKDLELTMENDEDNVHGSMLVTYYETTIGAKNTEGLLEDDMWKEEWDE